MILIVDDDSAMAETCSMMLESHGFEVNVAFNGVDALAKIGATSHELVISDCAMPGMTGMELSQRLKADPLTAQLPVLLMSGSLRSEIAQGTRIESFLRKPFLAENLLREVRKLLDTGAPPHSYSKV